MKQNKAAGVKDVKPHKHRKLKGKSRKPLSLYPLDLTQALRAAMQTGIAPKRKKRE